ncbi:MAG: hypothetical protein HQ488_01475 [Parcubacteria group bacterium]|nr:hypothetical protein [Parcubacteria group bacterium]
MSNIVAGGKQMSAHRNFSGLQKALSRGALLSEQFEIPVDPASMSGGEEKGDELWFEVMLPAKDGFEAGMSFHADGYAGIAVGTLGDTSQGGGLVLLEDRWFVCSGPSNPLFREMLANADLPHPTDDEIRRQVTVEEAQRIGWWLRGFMDLN